MDLTLTHYATCAECQFDLEIVELDLVGHSVRITVKPCQHCQQTKVFPEDKAAPVVVRECETCFDRDTAGNVEPCNTCGIPGKPFTHWRPRP